MSSLSQIHRLSQHVIHHIAAGEVIEKPVSVVKELIENAVDAQATRIEVEILQGGRERITVSDNGHGIERKSIPLMFERYATSKFKDIEDFHKLKSLGFRGEALFSIMTAADVTVMTRSYREQEGTWVRTHNGKVEEVRPIGCRIGMTIMIDRLFGRFPVRQQALESKKDLQQIKHLITQYALTYPQIGFVLKHNSSLLLSYFEQEEPVDRIAKTWQVTHGEVFELSATEDDWRFTTWIAHPQVFATHKQHQLIVVNERPVEMPALHQAIDQSLHTFRHAGRQPRYVFLLEVSPQLIDVNVHPQKLSVTLAQQDRILAGITQRLQQALSQLLPQDLRYTGQDLFQTELAESVRESLPLFLAGPYMQLNNMFIMTPTQSGFLLVDQHAADERLWYNALLNDVQLLNDIEKKITQECREELADDVYQHSFDDEINARIATIACHQAIRAGQHLTESEMSQLVRSTLDGGSETLVCPHGRPTHITVSQHQLETVFRRK
ncbi:MAG: DNA mismatch repair endonuclease MutL [Patescibacteria group bacterium]